MRSRIRTPFFFIPWGEDSTHSGEESPSGPVAGRALVGRVLGGRYLLREKTRHSPESVHYVAHDIMGNIDVNLEVYPDGTLSAGYRLGMAEAEEDTMPLPNLYKAGFTDEQQAIGEEEEIEEDPTPSWWIRIWATLIGHE